MLKRRWQPINQSISINQSNLGSQVSMKAKDQSINRSNGDNYLMKSFDSNQVLPNESIIQSIRGGSSRLNEKPLPCPQRDYMYSWKFPSILYFGWLTPLLRIGANRPLQFDDLWDTFPEEKGANCYREFEVAWVKETTKAAKANRPPKLVNVVVSLIGWPFLLACAIFGYTVFDQLIGPQILKQLTEYSATIAVREVPVIDGYQWALYLFRMAVVAAVCRSLALHLVTRLFIRVRNMLIIAVYQKSLRIPMRNRNDGRVNNLMSSDTQKLVEFANMILNLYSAPILIGVGIYELWLEVGWPGILGFAVMLLFLPVAGVMTGKQMSYQAKAAKETDRRITLISEIIQGIRVIKLSAWVAPFLRTLDAARERELIWLKRYAWLKSLTFGVLMLVPLMVSVTIFGSYVGIGGDMSPTVVFVTLSLVNVIRMPFTFLPIALAQLTQSLVALKRIGDFLALPDLVDQREKLSHVGIEMDKAEFTWGEEQAREEDKEDEKKTKPESKESEVDLVSGSSLPTAEGMENEEKKDQVLQLTLATDAAPTGVGGVIAVKVTETTNSTTINAITKNEQVSIEASDEKKVIPPRLTDVNLHAGPGELVMVIGPVGCGKSTLLYGMLGEVEQTAGRTSIGGNIAYVPQTPFIINATLKENITFGEKFDADRYAQVIHACALATDIELLPNGDMTEIGERGINLSGGQKSRVSIARAAYNSKAEIVLLDDPLSAVDMHVAQHIFTHCITGLMKNRLRILVTHSMAFVDSADKIVMLKETSVKDSYTTKCGSANQLRANDEEFSSLLARYNAGKDEMESDGEGGKAKRKANKKKKKGEGDAAAYLSKAKTKKDDLTETEERKEGAISWPVYKHYMRAGGNWFFYMAVPFFFAFTQAAQTSSDFVLAKWSNDLYVQSHPVGFWLGLYGGLIGITTMFTLARTTAMSLFGVRASRTLHHELGKSVLSKSMSWFDRTPSGRIINRFTKDMYLIDLLLSMMVEFAIATSLGVLGVLIVISIIVPISLGGFLVLAFFYVWTAEYYRRSNRELQRLESISRTPVFTHFAETLVGTASVRALKVQDMYMLENVRRVDLNSRALYFSRAVSFWLQTRLNCIGAVILGGAASLAVASPAIGDTVSTGNFGLLVSYALGITGFLNISVIIVSQVEAMMNSVERVDYYSVPRDQEAWDAKNSAISKSVQGGHWPSKGQISIKNLELRYRPDLDLVLRSINLEIPGGSKVGIVGRTGSGKSSMLVALFRLVEPCGGSISIDGVNLADIALDDVRHNIAIIPQDAFLFYGTFRYNLDPHSLYKDEDLWQALEYVQMKGVVERMPNQLETLIAEAGGNLSTGQRQLLCMARALLKKPRVICLDEATASVDIATDALIQHVVRTQFKAATVLTIAHRLNTILDYDMIVVLDRGNIAELGTPQELIKANGIFASMLQDKEGENEEA